MRLSADDLPVSGSVNTSMVGSSVVVRKGTGSAAMGPCNGRYSEKYMKECTVKLKFVLSFYSFMLFIIFQAHMYYETP